MQLLVIPDGRIYQMHGKWNKGQVPRCPGSLLRLIIGSDPTAMQVARGRSAWETARNRPALAPVERYPVVGQKRTRLLNTKPR